MKLLIWNQFLFPGIDVGMCWEYRVQLCEVGVHRPPVAGIAGTGSVGCQSIVLAGGYEDDVDNGYEFYYTGCGGRDLSGNKRTAEQSRDQVLEKFNLAIARNCNAPIDSVNGNEAKDWQKGKPIRVIRSYKMREHFEKNKKKRSKDKTGKDAKGKTRKAAKGKATKDAEDEMTEDVKLYGPEVGNRYDGIYKVVKYW